MTMEKKLDMVIEMVAHMNEEMTEKFDQIDQRFERVEERLANVEERLTGVEERLTGVEENLETLRKENAEEHKLLHSQIDAVAENI